ncbi:GAF and ANTAR domain-containing protein [soil metagenome]
MSEQSPVNESFAAMSRFFVGDGTVSETLTRIAELARDACPPATEVGIMLLVEGRVRTAVFTDEAVPEVDQAQYDTGEGPCLDAFRDTQPYKIDSTLDDGRWQAFRDRCVEHGILSTLSLPMIVNHQAIGALNLLARSERAFSDDDQELASRFAAQAAIVAANTQAYWDAHQLSIDLNEAMKSRAVIEQAKGMLMASQQCGADQAFELLVRASQRENVKLREIAARIVSAASTSENDVTAVG